jgi:hypothetical protein
MNLACAFALLRKSLQQTQGKSDPVTKLAGFRSAHWSDGNQARCGIAAAAQNYGARRTTTTRNGTGLRQLRRSTAQSPSSSEKNKGRAAAHLRVKTGPAKRELGVAARLQEKPVASTLTHEERNAHGGAVASGRAEARMVAPTSRASRNSRTAEEKRKSEETLNGSAAQILGTGRRHSRRRRGIEAGQQTLAPLGK